MSKIEETSVQELFGLSDADMRIIDHKIALKKAVKAYRLKAGLTQKNLAEMIDSNQSRIAKLEGGDASVSIEMMLNCLLHMGASDFELAEIFCKEVRKKDQPKQVCHSLR